MQPWLPFVLRVLYKTAPDDRGSQLLTHAPSRAPRHSRRERFVQHRGKEVDDKHGEPCDVCRAFEGCQRSPKGPEGNAAQAPLLFGNMTETYDNFALRSK